MCHGFGVELRDYPAHLDRSCAEYNGPVQYMMKPYIGEGFDRIHMRQNIDALIDPVGIAQHRMALAVFIDHQNHRLIGHRLDLIVKRRRQTHRSAAVDDHDALTGHDK